jgi:hypothetical protein
MEVYRSLAGTGDAQLRPIVLSRPMLRDREPIWLPAFLEAMRRTGGNVLISCDRCDLPRATFYYAIAHREDVRVAVDTLLYELSSAKVRKLRFTGLAAF